VLEIRSVGSIIYDFSDVLWSHFKLAGFQAGSFLAGVYIYGT
jgi:hypothetical protein